MVTVAVELMMVMATMKTATTPATIKRTTTPVMMMRMMITAMINGLNDITNSKLIDFTLVSL